MKASEHPEIIKLCGDKLEKMSPDMRRLFDLLADPLWRLNNLYWIQNEHGQKVRFRCTPIQLRFFRSIWWLNVILKARQTRLSTLCLLLALDTMLFKQGMTCGLIDITDEDAKRKLARVKFAYDHLDDPDDPVIAPIGQLIKYQMAPISTPCNVHEMTLGNGSKIWATTSMRGGAVNFLWITELGPIAAEFPDKASEIVSGAFNSVHRGNMIIIESTFKGGRFGKFYDLIRLAQRSPRNLNDMQYRFHFFAWHEEPTYALPVTGALAITDDQRKYFEGIEKLYSKTLTNEQKAWWLFKKASQKDAMSAEFPGTPEEAMRAMAEGAIYGEEMQKLRAMGRICLFDQDAQSPMWTFWDIGRSDYTCVWLVQFVRRDILVLDYYCSYGKGPAEHAVQIADWERTYRRQIAMNYLPHDAGHEDKSGKSWQQLMRDAGIEKTRIVPVTSDKWKGINHLRGLMGRMWFHAERCEQEFKAGEERILPSGIAVLEGYRKKVELANGRVVEDPVHDETSHGADALRTMSEAHMRGMLEGTSETAKESMMLHSGSTDRPKEAVVRHGLRSSRAGGRSG